MKQLKILLPTCQYAVFSIALYFILKMNFNSVFAGMISTICYPADYPIPFILMNCVTFFLTQITLNKLSNKIKSQFLKYAYFYLFWLMTTCVLGGLLGSYYDMEAGYYPAGEKSYKKLCDDMLFGGLNHGLYVIVFSIPYNIIVLIGSFVILKYNKIH